MLLIVPMQYTQLSETFIVQRGRLQVGGTQVWNNNNMKKLQFEYRSGFSGLAAGGRAGTCHRSCRWLGACWGAILIAHLVEMFCDISISWLCHPYVGSANQISIQ